MSKTTPKEKKSFKEKMIYLFARPAKESERKRHKTFVIILTIMYMMMFLIMLLDQDDKEKEEEKRQQLAIEQQLKEEKRKQEEKNEKAVYEVVYIGTFGKEHIDVLAENKHKMYRYKQEVAEEIKTLKEGMNFEITVFKTPENEWIIESLRKDIVPKKEKEEDKKETKKKNESVLGFQLTVPKGYELKSFDHPLENSETTGAQGIHGHVRIISKEKESNYVVIEEIEIDSDIQPERWRASSILKEIGALKELKGSKRPKGLMEKAEFVFMSKKADEIKYIWVIKEKDHLLRIEVTSENEENTHELIEIVNTLKY